MTQDSRPIQPLIEVRDLRKWFPIKKGFWGRHAGDVKAVDGVGFDIWPGETLALVGESGCGKTTVGRTVLRLVEPTAGSAKFEGTDLFTLDEGAMRGMRRHLQIVFQDPYSSLNPRMTVGSIIGDALELHGLARGDERFERAKELLERVGLQSSYVNRYPHEFSGGQRQRIGIARAIALKPKFIVCDEAVSALDVSVQAQVINLLEELQAELGLSYLFISHDLSVVRHISDRIAVMYLGRIVEVSRAEDLFEAPLHPYAQALLSAVPQKDPGRPRDRVILQGDPPNPAQPPMGCHFHTRCPLVMERCRIEAPALADRREGHRVACHLYDDARFPADPVDIRRPRTHKPLPPDAFDDSAVTNEHAKPLIEEQLPQQPVAIPKILEERDGMALGPFGEVVDPDDSFVSTSEVPTLDRLAEQSGVHKMPPELIQKGTESGRTRRPTQLSSPGVAMIPNVPVRGAFEPEDTDTAEMPTVLDQKAPDGEEDMETTADMPRPKVPRS